MADFEKLAAEVEKLSLPDLSQFVKFLEERWGVTAAAPMGGMMMMAGGGGAAEPVAEQTEFDLILQDVGPEKIKVIKAVREVKSDLGLKEAKDFVESAPAPLLTGVAKEIAEAGKKALEEAGAKATVK